MTAEQTLNMVFQHASTMAQTLLDRATQEFAQGNEPAATRATAAAGAYLDLLELLAFPEHAGSWDRAEVARQIMRA